MEYRYLRYLSLRTRLPWDVRGLVSENEQPSVQSARLLRFEEVSMQYEAMPMDVDILLVSVSLKIY